MLTINDLLNKVRSYNLNNPEIIVKAYDYAKEMHDGQMRQSGEPYIIHPLTVAYILAGLHADTDTICAGLLHDTLEDTKATKKEIANLFNNDVANLVDGVTKISKMNFTSKQEQNLANTRKIITGLTSDVRIIIIKLADRLHNMRTLQYKSEFKQKENSIETLEIFVPLAYLIGAYRIKSELEDISFKYLLPDKYKKIEESMLKNSEEYNKTLQEMYQTINQILASQSIPHEIKIRTKNYYSIFKKLERGSKISDIHDLLSLKIVVDEIKNCYLTLGYIHSEYNPVNSKFKDYICNPKTNMYRSLHTTVFAPDERLVQTQIRTFDMDRVASFGIMTYWDIYKGNTRTDMQQLFNQKYKFINSLVLINDRFSDNKEFVNSVKNEIFADKVYVHDSKGGIIDLPIGSTIIDYAYKLGENIGNKLFKAKVNNKEVDLNYVLHNKDRVLVFTDDLSNGPNEEWLDYVQTTLAQEKIKKYRRK